MPVNGTNKHDATVTTVTTSLSEKQPEQSSSSGSSSTHRAAYERYCTTLGMDVEKGITSFDERIRRDYRLHTIQYWLVASAANGMLWAQIIIGAAITALGAGNAPGSKTATIFLGAASTVIAGFLTYFKSRSQPNRSRQFRQALRKVRNKMDETANQLDDTTTPEEAHARAMEILKLYDEAIAEAAANYPDLWVTVNDMRKYLHGTGNQTQSSDPNAGASGPDAMDAVVKPDIVAPPTQVQPQPQPPSSTATAPAPGPVVEPTNTTNNIPASSPSSQDGAPAQNSPNPVASQETAPSPVPDVSKISGV
ncbi:hypothetical protein PV11_10105 [Exophiala sideris]|uniref:SMODS and SLOG-associating 2TM effector domain-containing protein n=1 Tax=Exophiala sideris TaxID=1016849 RepID=A0A0D1YU20_9EURO|nr:hypothetical protein PV11_10105 [Exophiala sideris]